MSESQVPESAFEDDHNGDHSIERVPESETVHGLRVALVLIGIAITIPAFLTGAEIGLAMGMEKASLVIPAGSLFLCIIGCLAAVIAAQSRLTTYMIIQFSFGRSGAKLVNLVLSITIFGWFSVTASFFGESIQQAMLAIWDMSFSLNVLIAIGSLLVIVTTVFGFQAIDKLALLAVPMLFAALIALVYLALRDSSLGQLQTQGSNPMALGDGITAVIGGFIVGAVIMPDYCRFVRNSRHGILAAVLHFGVGYPLILLMLALVSVHTGERNFISVMSAMGLGLTGFLVLIFATWTTNTGNLYSNSLVLKTIFTGIPMWLLVVAGGVLGTLLAIAGITQYFIGFLLFLGISIPPIVGIYFVDYFLVHKRNYRVERLTQQPAIAYPAFIAWLVATAVAFTATRGWFTFTTIPSCDAILVAAALYLGVSALKGDYAPAHRPS